MANRPFKGSSEGSARVRRCCPLHIHPIPYPPHIHPSSYPMHSISTPLHIHRIPYPLQVLQAKRRPLQGSDVSEDELSISSGDGSGDDELAAAASGRTAHQPYRGPSQPSAPVGAARGGVAKLGTPQWAHSQAAASSTGVVAPGMFPKCTRSEACSKHRAHSGRCNSSRCDCYVIAM